MEYALTYSQTDQEQEIYPVKNMQDQLTPSSWRTVSWP